MLIDQVFKRCIQGSAGEKISSSLTLCVLQNFRINGPLYDAVSIAEDDQWRRIRSVLTPSFTTGRQKEVSASPGQTGLSGSLRPLVIQQVQCCNSTLIEIPREQEQGQESKTRQKELIPPLWLPPTHTFPASVWLCFNLCDLLTVCLDVHPHEATLS